MELTMNTRREIIKKMAPEYQKATKKEKRSEMNSSISLDTPERMPPGSFLIMDGKSISPDKTAKNIESLDPSPR